MNTRSRVKKKVSGEKKAENYHFDSLPPLDNTRQISYHPLRTEHLNTTFRVTGGPELKPHFLGERSGTFFPSRIDNFGKSFHMSKLFPLEVCNGIWRCYLFTRGLWDPSTGNALNPVIPYPVAPERNKGGINPGSILK